MEKGLDLLIVEDSTNDAHLISRILRQQKSALNFQLLTDGQQALDYLLDERTPRPAVLLLDLKLPRMTGLEVLERIRLQNDLRVMPIVMFSSSTLDSDLQKAYSLGVNSYLVKPRAYQDLKTMIRHFSDYWFMLNKQPKHD